MSSYLYEIVTFVLASKLIIEIITQLVKQFLYKFARIVYKESQKEALAFLGVFLEDYAQGKFTTTSDFWR